mmetsp:Transcript_52736/g.142151  ORF Transcript_52736/g.142151 Transcript_52736/m.142151 type:complete len:294 (-) Transcript_52736:256-1137(-)
MLDILCNAVLRPHSLEAATIDDPPERPGRRCTAQECCDAGGGRRQVCLHVFEIDDANPIRVQSRQTPPAPHVIKVAASILCRAQASQPLIDPLIPRPIPRNACVVRVVMPQRYQCIFRVADNVDDLALGLQIHLGAPRQAWKGVGGHVHFQNARPGQALELADESRLRGNGALHEDGMEVVVGVGPMKDADSQLHHPRCATPWEGDYEEVVRLALKHFPQGCVSRGRVQGTDALASLQGLVASAQAVKATAGQCETLNVVPVVPQGKLHLQKRILPVTLRVKHHRQAHQSLSM